MDQGLWFGTERPCQYTHSQQVGTVENNCMGIKFFHQPHSLAFWILHVHQTTQTAVISVNCERTPQQILSEVACEGNHCQQFLACAAIVQLKWREVFDRIGKNLFLPVLHLGQNSTHNKCIGICIRPSSLSQGNPLTSHGVGHFSTS